MRALIAILNAVRRAVQRDLGTYASIKVNNFFLFVWLLIAGALETGLEPKSAEPLLVLLGFLMLFPMSSDPLARIPPDRLSVWPVSRGQRVALRAASVPLSPIFWITLLLMARMAGTAAMWSFAGLVVGVQGAHAFGSTVVTRDPRWNLLRYGPRIPGRLGGLIRHNTRQLLSVLDTYAALLMSLGGAAYLYLSPNPDLGSRPILSLLIALAISTYPQSLFGLDGGAGVERYRLLPLSGRAILLAKGVPFLAVLLVLILPFDPWPGLTFGFAALAIGHHSTVFLRMEQRRWRFTSGRLLPVGAVQALGGVAVGFAEVEYGALVLLLAGVAWLASLAWYGHCWDRTRS